MKVLSAEFGVLLLVLLTQRSQQLTLNLDSDEDVCRLFPDGAEIRKPGTCGETIVCKDFKSTEGKKCTNSAQGWKLETKACAKVSDTYCTSSNCKKNGDTWVVGIRNCHEWTYCNGTKILAEGTCPTGQVFSQDLQMCIYEKLDYKCASTYDICNVSPQDQKFLDEVNCNKYYTCSKAQKLVTNLCPDGTYYVARTGECITKALVSCNKHPYPDDVCGTTKLAIRNHFVGDKATCRGYFYCKDAGSGKPDTSPVWGQCPDDTYFDSAEETCKHRAYVKCNEDRCDSRSSGWELSQTSGCQHYLVCQNGFTIAEEKCPDNKYFDPFNLQCVSAKVSYPACA